MLGINCYSKFYVLFVARTHFKKYFFLGEVSFIFLKVIYYSLSLKLILAYVNHKLRNKLAVNIVGNKIVEVDM